MNHHFKENRTLCNDKDFRNINREFTKDKERSRTYSEKTTMDIMKTNSTDVFNSRRNSESDGISLNSSRNKKIERKRGNHRHNEDSNGDDSKGTIKFKVSLKQPTLDLVLFIFDNVKF